MNRRRSIILSALGQYGRQFIMFGASVVVARLPTPVEIGAWFAGAVYAHPGRAWLTGWVADLYV